jgi:glutamyl-tRNA reductase
MFILDLAVPRDFDPAIGERPDIYLYSIDDLKAACERNRQARDKELPAALKIVDREAARFVRDWRHRATGPVIEQLRQGWEKPKEEELRRLLNKLPQLDERGREEVRRAFDRLVNKLLHQPMESLRDEARKGVPQALVEALAKLFRLRD